MIALELSGIGGGSESIETLITPVSGLAFANAIEVSCAVIEEVVETEITIEPKTEIRSEVALDMCPRSSWKNFRVMNSVPRG